MEHSIKGNIKTIIYKGDQDVISIGKSIRPLRNVIEDLRFDNTRIQFNIDNKSETKVITHGLTRKLIEESVEELREYMGCKCLIELKK